MRTTRRQFLHASFGGALGLALTRMPALGAGRANAIQVGFQLYTVRGEFSRDVPGTIKRLGQLGYRGVEFWGYNATPNVYQQYSAAQLRKFLDESGLQCCGMHLTLKALARENLNQTMEINRTLGNPYLNVAAAKDKMGSEKAIAELANLLNEASAECRSHQMMVGYHAHPFDFEKFNGRFGWEILFSRTQPEVKMQMDVGNCLGGGGDPIAMLKKFPGRTPTIHIKEHEEKTFDSAFYKEVFQLCETSCGTRWYIIEQGGEGGNSFNVPQDALAKLRRVGR